MFKMSYSTLSIIFTVLRCIITLFQYLCTCRTKQFSKMTKAKQNESPEWKELWTATENDDFSAVKQIVSGLSQTQIPKLLTRKNSYDDTLLHLSACAGRKEITQFYLEQLDLDDRLSVLNIECSCGSTPLQRAANNGHTELVRYILSFLTPEQTWEHLTAQNSQKDSALHRAAWNGHLETVSYILDSVAPQQKVQLLGIQNNEGDTPLHDLASNNHVHCMQHALNCLDFPSQMSLLNKRNCEGMSPFHLTIQRCSIDTLKVIIQSFQLSGLLLTFLILQKLPKESQTINDNIRECLPIIFPNDPRLTRCLDRYFQKDLPVALKSVMDELVTLLGQSGKRLLAYSIFTLRQCMLLASYI